MGQSRYALLFLSLVVWAVPVYGGQRTNPFTGKPDFTGVDVQLTDCSGQTTEGRTCWDTDNDTLYVGDGTTANALGGGGNSFETVAVPAGASVVADSATDTLTLTETSFLTLTGTAATDTIDITQVTTDLGTDGLIAANAVALGTDTTGAYVADLVATTAETTVSGGGAENATVTIGLPDEVTVTTSLTVVSTDPADAGAIRLNNAATVCWEESPAGTDACFLYDGTTDDDFELSNDLTIEDATPHLRLTDTTASHDDFEWYADASQVYLTNVTDAVELVRFNASNHLFLRGGSTTYAWPTADGTSGQFISTNGSGVLSFATGSGGNSFETIAVPAGTTPVADSSTDTLTLTETAGVDIAGTAGTDTIDFAVDLTEVNTLTLGAGAFTTMTFDSGATDPSFTPGNATITLTPGGSDFIVADDLELQDVTPHLRLTDTTASQDDFELWADNSVLYLSNVTDAVQLLYVDASNRVHIPNLVSCDSIDSLADGRLVCGSDATGVGGGDAITVATVAATDPDFIAGDITWTLDTAATPDTIAGTVAANAVALTTDTTGSYAAGDAEAGAALTGDTATAFFSTGQLEAARGGTGADSSASTGIAQVSAGAWSVDFTLSPGGADMIIEDDAELQDATPHLRLTDTTASEDDFEWYADVSQVYLTNVTDAVELLRWNSANAFFLRGSGVTYAWPTADGTNGQFLTTNASGTLTWTTSSGSGAFSDAADPVVLNTTTKDVSIGPTFNNTAKLSVDGDTDQIQLSLQGFSTQTTSLMVAENSAGTDVFTVSNTGVVVTGGSAGAGMSTVAAGLTVNNGSTGTANDDLMANGDTVAGLLTVDASEDDIELGGQVQTTGTAPALSSCGTSPSISATATDMSGKITIGTSAADTCTLTFAATWDTIAPACVVMGEDSAITLAATSSTTVLTITAPGATDFSSDVLMYHCFGNE